MKHSYVTAILTAVIFVLTAASIATAKDNVQVEGIVYEAKNPSQSFVSIGGEFYQKGTQYLDYEIVEIREDRIVVKDKTGHVTEHRLQTSAAAAASSSNETETGKTDSTSGEAKDPMTALMEQLKKMYNGLDPAALMNYAMEVAVMADIRKLYIQVMAAAMESYDSQAQNLDKLIAAGLVDPAFKKGKNGYAFRVVDAPKGPQIFADPIKGGDKSKHFMIDSWGNLREEIGKPATDKSPLRGVSDIASKLIPKTPAPNAQQKEMERQNAG